MKVAVLKERGKGERRVAIVPESVKKLSAAGMSFIVESGAGVEAHFPDSAYEAVGAKVEKRIEDILPQAALTAKVGVPTAEELALMAPGHMLLTSLMPTRNIETVRQLIDRRITAFSTDAIPRTTRAQAMDTLSSMASIAGYKGVLMGAIALGRYLPMFTTAAGTIFPAKLFVIGAGVAGLQAIATAKRLGANVFATDVRPEVKEQIESVGGKYVGIEVKHGASAGGGYAKELSEEDKLKQAGLLAEQCAVSDIVITTALIGGVFAPKLLSAKIVSMMKPGAIIVDLAAEGGGNCELSRPGETVTHNGVSIMAPLNVPSMMATDASVMWSRNLTNFLLNAWKDAKFNMNMEDEIIRGATITHNAEILHAKTKEALDKLAAPAMAH